MPNQDGGGNVLELPTHLSSSLSGGASSGNCASDRHSSRKGTDSISGDIRMTLDNPFGFRDP